MPMSDSSNVNGHEMRARVAREMADTIDEELELEIDEERLDQLLAETSNRAENTIDRHIYFKELFRLQGD
jgi:polyphosphate kinase